MNTADFSEEELQEFTNESKEMLDQAERYLLDLEGGADFKASYDAVFRIFHSIKGASGMLGMHQLEGHMHQLENQYQQCQKLDQLPAETLTYFLAGVDSARQLMEGKEVQFDYTRAGLRALPRPQSEATPVATTPVATTPVATTPVAATPVEIQELLEECIHLLFENYSVIEESEQRTADPSTSKNFQARFTEIISKKQQLFS